MRERQRLDASMSAVRALENELMDALGLIELAEAENDSAMVADAEKSIVALTKRAEERRLESMLSGEADGNDTYLEVHAGAGGTESQDWAEMLFRMYTRWAERHGYKLQLIEESEGEAAGLKSATLLVKGRNAYGWLKSEAGVHRLVRISPFDSNARRHTSFSSVTVYLSRSIDQTSKSTFLRKTFVSMSIVRLAPADSTLATKLESAVALSRIFQPALRLPVRLEALATSESGGVLGYAALTALRDRVGEKAGGNGRVHRRENGYRLGSPDPLLCPAALSAGESICAPVWKAAHRTTC